MAPFGCQKAGERIGSKAIRQGSDAGGSRVVHAGRATRFALPLGSGPDFVPPAHPTAVQAVGDLAGGPSPVVRCGAGQVGITARPCRTLPRLSLFAFHVQSHVMRLSGILQHDEAEAREPCLHHTQGSRRVPLSTIRQDDDLDQNALHAAEAFLL